MNMWLVPSSSPAFHCSTERKMADCQGYSGGRFVLSESSAINLNYTNLLPEGEWHSRQCVHYKNWEKLEVKKL